MCFLQTPKVNNFLKHTSELIGACESQSKVKALDKLWRSLERSKTQQKASSTQLNSLSLSNSCKAEILEKDAVSTMLSKASLWQESISLALKHVG